MADVQKHSGDVLEWTTMLRSRREIEKWKKERMGISLMCTSLDEKAPVSRSVRPCSALFARMLVFQRGNGEEMEPAV